MSDTRVGGVVDTVRAVDERRWAAWLHYASLVIGFVVLMVVARHQWFSGDEWDFVVKRGLLGDSTLGLFEPHNEHWVSGAILVYRALFSVFGVRTYMPYLAVLFLFQVAVAHLLWRIMLRAGVRPILATAAAAVFVVLGAGWENLLNAFQITFVAPVAFGLLALLLMPEEGRFGRRDAYGWICNVLALTFSGVGITMVLIVGGTALFRRGWRVALAVVSVPGVVYLLWYAKWGRHVHAVEQQPLRTSLQTAPAFVWRGLTDAVDATTGLVGTAAVLLVLLALWIARACRPDREPWPVLLPLTLGAPVFLFLVDIRRSGLGVPSAGSSRYVWIIVALIVPVTAYAATRLLADRSLALGVTAVATALLLVVALSALNDNAGKLAPTKQENERRLVAAVDLLRSGDRVLSDFPLPELNPDITNAPLLALARDDALPGITVSEADRLAAAMSLQVVGRLDGTAAPRTPGEGTIEEVSGATSAPAAREGCTVIRPTTDQPAVALSFSAPGHVTLSPRRGGQYTAVLTPAGQAAPTSGPQAWAVAGGDRLVLSVSATGPWVRIALPANSPTTICRVGAS